MVGAAMSVVYVGLLWLVNNDDIRAIGSGVGRLIRRVCTGRE